MSAGRGRDRSTRGLLTYVLEARTVLAGTRARARQTIGPRPISSLSALSTPRRLICLIVSPSSPLLRYYGLEAKSVGDVRRSRSTKPLRRYGMGPLGRGTRTDQARLGQLDPLSSRNHDLRWARWRGTRRVRRRRCSDRSRGARRPRWPSQQDRARWRARNSAGSGRRWWSRHGGNGDRLYARIDPCNTAGKWLLGRR